MKISISTNNFKEKKDINWSNVVYLQRESTIDEFVSLLKEGYCFTHLFKNEMYNTFNQNEKTNDNFKLTNMVIFDIDDCLIPIDEYYERLTIKPTILYSTFNNGIKGYRFRLIYIFNDDIYNTEYKNIYQNLKINLNIINDDTRCCSLSHQFYGNPIKNAIYFVSKTLLDKNGYITPIDKENSTESLKMANTSVNVDNVKKMIDNTFLEDMDSMIINDFIGKYYERYNFNNKFIPDFSDDECYQIIDKNDEYRLITRWRKNDEGHSYICKFKDGENRRNKLYINGSIIFHKEFKGNMRIEHLIYVLMKEVFLKFDNSDNTFNNNFIIDMAYRILTSEDKLKMCNKPRKFSINPKYIEEVGLQKAIGNIRKDITTNNVLSNYDLSKSVKENYEILNSIGVNISIQHLYKILKDNNISTVKENNWKDYININLSTKENIEILRNNGFSTKRETVSRYLSKIRKEHALKAQDLALVERLS